MSDETRKKAQFSDSYQTTTYVVNFLAELLPDGEGYATNDIGYDWRPCPIHSKHKPGLSGVCSPLMCAGERLIHTACAAAGRPRFSHTLACCRVVLWTDTLYRILAYYDPVASTFASLRGGRVCPDCSRDGLACKLDRPSIRSPKLISSIRTQYKKPLQHGRTRETYRESKLRYMGGLGYDLEEELDDAWQRLSSLSEVVGLLWALHRYVKDRANSKVMELEIEKQELEDVKLQMMMVDDMPKSKARMVVAPEMERLELECKALHDETAFQDSENARLWLQLEVIKPLEEARKGWMRIIRSYENEMLGLDMLMEKFNEMYKTLDRLERDRQGSQ